MGDEETADQVADGSQQDAEANKRRARLVKLIATEELPRIRQRGITDLDLTAHNRKPVSCKGVEQLARLHCETKGLDITSRPPLVRNLIDDALTAYAEQNEAAARFIRELFFDPDDTAMPRSPGDLLITAREKAGMDDDPQKFDRLRRKEFAKFSEFLADFVVDDPPEPLSPEAKLFRLEMQLPKGYLLVSRGQRIWAICYLSVILTGLILLAFPTLYRMNIQNHFPLSVGNKSVQTYREPSVDATEGSIIKPGKKVNPKCIAQIVRQGKVVFWVRIKTEPWKDYYAPITAFEGNEKQAYSLLGDGVPFCPTK
ncbi:hypothetical protein [Streptomyces prunicolor]|uniref:hypothetical protein n=1 Tax=Streptomyces prunicolor TaxID=67348 RepID=UPI0034176282